MIKSLRTIFHFFLLTIFASTGFAQGIDNMSFTDEGSGIPLVLIHAFPSDQTLWQPQQEGLKNHFRVITLDLKGFGHAQATNGEAVTMEEYADQIKLLLDKLNIEKAIVGGESMGGYVSLAFLKKYPKQVRGLILSDTQTIADNAETKTKREKLAQEVLSNGSEQLIKDFLPKALSKNANEETKVNLQKIFARQSPTAIASALRGMALREDTSDLLANTALPVLIITGEDDVVISPDQSKHMNSLAKNSRLIVIANTGHLSSLEQPSAWNEAVIEYFNKTY